MYRFIKKHLQRENIRFYTCLIHRFSLKMILKAFKHVGVLIFFCRIIYYNTAHFVLYYKLSFD